MLPVLRRDPPHAELTKRVYLVIRGDRLKFLSDDRALAEAYFHGQAAGAAILLSARILQPRPALPRSA